MHPNQAVIEKFYTYFKRLDANGMLECYHKDIVFSDPAFPHLQGPMVGNMWKMLCSQAQNFELNYTAVKADDNEGSALWEAQYLFSRTRRNVHNKIAASFVFKDGKIIQHIDDFNFWKFSAMALGPVGVILGWTPILKSKVQKQAAVSLQKFAAKAKTSA